MMSVASQATVASQAMTAAKHSAGDVLDTNTVDEAESNLKDPTSKSPTDEKAAPQPPSAQIMKSEDAPPEEKDGADATGLDGDKGSIAASPSPATGEVSDLKAELEELKKEVKDLAEKLKKENEEEKKKEDDKPLSLNIKKLSMEQWQPSRGFEGEDIRGNVLVVYYKAVVRTSSSEATSDTGTRALDERLHETPQRVQINSRPLLAELEHMTGTSMSKTPCVMIPPFKVLVTCRDKIEQEIKAKQKVAHKQNDDPPKETPAGPPTAEVAAAKKETKRAKLVAEHLECLLKFIDTDLAEILQLRQQIKTRSITHIAFEHLWHLFNVGDLVFNNKKKAKQDGDEFVYHRAFRVYHVALGRPTISARLKDKESLSTSETKAKMPESQRQDAFTFPFYVDLHYVDYDGVSLSPESTSISTTIRDYQGKRKIVDLDFYPAEFAPDYDTRREALIARGKKFLDHVGTSHQYYRGLTVGDDPEYVEGEVVIDAKTGYEYDTDDNLKSLGYTYEPTPAQPFEYFEVTGCGNTSCDGCTNNYNDAEYDTRRLEAYNSLAREVIVDDEKEKITEEHLLLLPKDIPGFVLRDRTWKRLDVEQIRDVRDQVDEEKTGFKELVIKKDHKDTILALVKSHATGSSRGGRENDSNSMDLVKGKGEGLIILLHGAPGVGKTSTAETVAAYTNRPLYPITCGDIGEKAEEVEQSLHKHFKLAHKWGCVLLLDEADVFLAKRHEGDVQRNALVSVFLRTLEYYSGILFLTTNRLGAIDEAFHSRIKMSFYYKQLNEERTVEIWENCLKKIQRTNEKGTDLKVEFDGKEIISFARNHFRDSAEKRSRWNGRQIRNAFQTALALARYDRLEKLGKKGISEEEANTKKNPKYRTVHLEAKHFKRVAKVTTEYHSYVFLMQKNKSLDQAAAESQNRALDSDFENAAIHAPKAGTRASRQLTPMAKAKSRREKPKRSVESVPFEELHFSNSDSEGSKEQSSSSSSSTEDEEE